MAGAQRSLLDYLDAPVVVGDPDGRAVYLNPAFAARFAVAREDARGRPLASLFEGGGREGVLRAVAAVCAGGQSLRFRIREGGVGYAAIASPISAERDRVGVVVLLTEEARGDDRVLAAHRSLQASVDDLSRSLAEMPDSRAAHGPLADAMRSAEALRKELETLQTLLAGGERGAG